MSRKVLCLGPDSISKVVARSYAALGFPCLLQSELTPDPLPSLADPKASAQISELFQKFRQKAQADSLWVHPCATVWAERPELLSIAEQNGIEVVAPGARVLSLFGNKLQLLLESEKLGIPNLVLHPDPVLSVREIEKMIAQFAERAKPFPFVLKSVRGESNLRLFVLHRAEQLERELPLWIEQLRESAGEILLFAERYVEGARHVVLPFVRFRDGRFRCFPSVDVSLQSRFRKIIEVCPSKVSAEGAILGQMEEWTRKIADHSHYVGVGTLEFFVDGNRAYLVEGSARLNTEFHLWERVAGTSAVAYQMASLSPEFEDLVQEGGSHPDFSQNEAGISLRLYAEDPILQLPQPGEVVALEAPVIQRPNDGQTGWDFSVKEGTLVDPAGYGMIGSFWAFGESYSQALGLAKSALDTLWIAGGLQTNQRFLRELLDHPWIEAGIFHASFIDEEFIPTVLPESEFLALFAAVAAASLEPELKEGCRWTVGRVKSALASEIHWVKEPTMETSPNGKKVLRGVIEFENKKYKAMAYALGEDRWQVTLGAWVLPVRKVALARTGPLELNALVSGKVHSILFQTGAGVPPHEPMIIIESLRHLVPHAVPLPIRILKWAVSAEEEVLVGQTLATVEKDLTPKVSSKGE